MMVGATIDVQDRPVTVTATDGSKVCGLDMSGSTVFARRTADGWVEIWEAA